MPTERVALLAVPSEILNDPRVRREIDWLTDAGWVVDTLGFGPHPSPQVRTHFELLPPTVWESSPWRQLVLHGLMTNSAKFRRIIQQRIPSEAADAVRAGTYDLIVFNDRELAPWSRDRDVFGGLTATHIHLDMHEYFTQRMRERTPFGLLAWRWQRWLSRRVADSHFTSRSTVSNTLADLYVRDHGMTRPTVIRNMPERIHADPRPVDPQRIHLIYHGLAHWERGLRDVIDAMQLLDDRFELTFMLTGNPRTIEEVRRLSAPYGGRILFRDPVPVKDISRTINAYDLAVMFYRPISPNIRYSLPNKLFEAVQGRIGVVTGRSVAMIAEHEPYGFGIVVPQWGPAALARALNALDAHDIDVLKAHAHEAAGELHSDTDRSAFLRAVGAIPPHPGPEGDAS
ncbi:MAG: glycosyltransferase [Actinobacteria bacterium]|nr:glycosyltransferase [Actinomycetota bacterium]MBU1609368.1 glycosyltransferase [Actinomycetota bacterium]MBU2315000.1 glycosyltransferase [Actinomycetota bacterium]MBU2385034.1 glycosyltransferase [Actinomycetota bacterium]